MFNHLIAFRGKSWQLLTALFFFAISVNAQTLDTSRVRQGIYANPGYDYIGIGTSKTLRPPQDTIPQAARDSGAIAVKNGIMYIWNGSSYKKYGKATQLTDSSFIVGNDTITIRGTGGGGGAPSGPAGGDLTGTYPNPNIANNAVTIAKLSASGTAGHNSYHRGDDYWASPQESYLGTIYKNNSWANLSDFTTIGGITAAASSGKINISGGAGTFTQTLDLNWYTMLERWKMTTRFKVTTVNGSSYGIGIGIHSTNGYGTVNAIGRIDLSTGGSAGKVVLNGHTDNRQMAISSSGLSFSNNDTIELRLERKVDSLIVTAINRSQSNASVSTSMAYELVSGVPQLPNTGRFSIFAFGGTQSIDSIAVTSDEIKSATLLVMGDSKTQGYYAQTFAGRYSSKLNNNLQSTVLHSGGYDRTTEWLTYLPEIKVLSPKQVLLTNPSNDARSGISSSTSHAQYQQVVDSLTSWGIDVYHALAFYESSQDNSGWNTYIASTFPANKIIDTWNPTKNCTGCVTGDGVHLTAKGNDTIATTIINSYNLYGGVRPSAVTASGSVSGTDNYVPIVSSGALIDSRIHQDGSRTYVSNGFESNGISPGFSLYNTSAGTDEKGWQIYNDATHLYISAFNDARSSAVAPIVITRSGVSSATTDLIGNVGITGNINLTGMLTTTGSGSGVIFNRRDNNAAAWGALSLAGNMDFYDQVNSAVKFSILPAGKLHIYDTVQADARISYNSNLHGSFTQFSLVDKAYVDSVVSSTAIVLKGSTTWDPASISANSNTSTTITVTGASLGDPVTISKTSGSYSNGEVYFAYVSATNTVTIQLQNTSGGTFDIASATFNVIVLKY